MEAINQHIFEMIRQLQFVHRLQEKNQIPANAKDSYGFSFEPDASISMEPLEFLETAMKLDAEAWETFRLACVVNRHSPLFFSMAGNMEKLLSLLGSVCITKAVMEQQGETSRFLENLTIESLREKTAFIFRKAYSSFMESAASYHYNREAQNISIRFAALDKRLIATDEKIRLIWAGKIHVDLTGNNQPAGSQQPEPVNDPEKNAGDGPENRTEAGKGAVPFSEKSRAFSIDRAALEKTPQQHSAEAAEPEPSRTGIPEMAAVLKPETDAGIPDRSGTSPEEAVSADIPKEPADDEEALPFVSEDPVQRMWEDDLPKEMSEWPFPQYAYASLPP